jgi:hypothetical protein
MKKGNHKNEFYYLQKDTYLNSGGTKWISIDKLLKISPSEK